MILILLFIQRVSEIPSGYMLYSSHVRSSVTNDLTEKLGDGEKLRGPDVMKGIAVRWKGLADSERNSWNTKAKTNYNAGGRGDPVNPCNMANFNNKLYILYYDIIFFWIFFFFFFVLVFFVLFVFLRNATPFEWLTVR